MLQDLLVIVAIAIGAPCPIGAVALIMYIVFRDPDGVVRF